MQESGKQFGKRFWTDEKLDARIWKATLYANAILNDENYWMQQSLLEKLSQTQLSDENEMQESGKQTGKGF